MGWEATLRSRGYRLTPQRQLVLEAVQRLGHATPEDVAAEVRRVAGAVSLSTVYRTLELLEELSLVRHAHLGHGAPTFHPAADTEHVHLVCRDCDSVSEVGVAEVAESVARLAADRDFAVDLSHFAIFGRCGRCRRAAGDRAQTGQPEPDPDQN